MIENVLQSFIIHAAGHDLLDLNGRGMERGVDAEHDFLVADGVVGVNRTLMEVPEVSNQILSYFFAMVIAHRDTVGMSHMDHDDREMRVAFSQKSDLPRKRERRMTGMDERFAVFFADLSDGIHARIIGAVAEKDCFAPAKCSSRSG